MGYMWFGTFGGGLNRFDRRTSRFKAYRHSPSDPSSLSNDTVCGLFIDRKGRLWVATDDGLSLFNPQTEGFERFRQGQGKYHAMAEDSTGSLWLATWDTGVERLDPATGAVTSYRHSSARGSLNDDQVNAIYIDHSGIVWVGTQSALNRFDPAKGTFTAYNEHDGLPNANVTGILEDKRGDLWLGTNNGLSRFKPSENTFKNYYVSDGILGNEFYGFNVAWKSPTGEMFFGSLGGLTAFFPDQVIENPYVPPVVLTDFQLLGKPAQIGANSPLKHSISLTDSLTLNHTQNIFSFEFSALSYANPERNRYRYRLEGLDTVWNEADSRHRSVMYTTLPPGEYVFHVLGSNNRGIWNMKGVSVSILILPPVWATWWFRAGCVLTVLICLWALHQLRLRQLAAQFNMRLEERVGERTRIARELHDTLLQSFHGLMLCFQAVYNLLPARPAEAKQRLESALDRAAQAITEGRDAVQELRSSTVVTNDLAWAISALGEELAAHETGDATPAFHVEVEGTPRDLHPILRDEIYRIGGEALRNAFRHAQARRIHVEIRYGDRQLQLRVADDGKGIDTQFLGERRPAGHWGLAGMRERAELIGGSLEVWSELGAGTEVELSMPASAAYAASHARRRFRFPWKRTEANQ
jgi:signal transduction histidine kinase/streptogramin lyase